MTPLSIGVHVSNHDSVAEALRVARIADAVGVDAIWIAEDLYFHGAVPLAAAIAVQTSAARIGFSVLTPYGHHPARLAMDLATLVELAPGRVILGLGAGVRARIERMGATWQNPVGQVRHYLDTLQRLLAGDTVTSADPSGPGDELALSMANPPGPLPVYVAAVGPRALQQAGRLYDGVLLSVMGARPHLERSYELVARGAEEAGRPVPAVVASIPIQISADGAAAVVEAKQLVGHLMTRWASIPSLRALFTTDGYLEEHQFDTITDRLHRGEEPAVAVPGDIAVAHCPAGTPDEVADQIASLGETGVRSISIDPGSITDDDELRGTLGGIIARTRTGTDAPATAPSRDA